MNWSDIKHFDPSEFACHCGECESTGEEMNLHFVAKLEQLRERFQNPMIVTSGYRCPEHNNNVSSTGLDGPHTTGRAADILVSGEEAFHLMQQCSLGGWMSGIGINQRGPYEKRFIHLDDLKGPDHPRPRVWTY